jgi:mannose/fructose/N-acetylgalactosamine-specific phosphotransferase system component IIB
VIVASRVDNRLIHGQVVEAWVPHLRVERLVVADDATAADTLAAAAMTLAVPSEVEVALTSLARVNFAALAADAVRTLVLFREVDAAVEGRARGLPDGLLMVGNVHAAADRVAVTRSVHLTPNERRRLVELTASGMRVVAQSVPSEKPVPIEN